ANLQEQVLHNFRHHFVAGAFAATTRRQLSSRHPICFLLEPHIAHTLYVNRIIFNTLRTPGSAVDNQFAGDLEEDREILIQARKKQSWRDLSLETDLAR